MVAVPSPSPCRRRQPRPGLHPAFYIINWMFFSNLTILFNKWIIDSAGFTILLTCWHLVLVIVAGVAIASAGEIEFSLTGFIYQVGGIIFEAIRIVLIEVMLSDKSHRPKIDPLVSLYYYAPICAVMNFLVAIPTELPTFQWQDVTQVGFSVFFLNALAAFMLNVASVFLIGKTSGLIMTLASIMKNMLLVLISIIIWNTKITLTQFFGYSISLAGLVYYSVGFDQLFWSYQTAVKWAAATLDSSPINADRRVVLASGIALCVIVIYVIATQF
ncbi:triose-phosphate transporter family protein [Hirsutella rhossiliensis]|uniref:Triose-phosphate transporter family domain-containing protein n=1 Tax=Hirsutella rhossiliensis TaxID=111463 RepID=A0A9P8MWT9_9HYPO|nr:triose-phosphate transporter family domain-containing protein [Hirsutella rhossiliensis]KAH0963743.1 triose-phosphate transporter family domain-containing protein [Hirsutella rhossiliensis]